MKNLFTKISGKRGFTLTEVLIGISILTVAIVSATNLLITIVQSNKNNVKTLQAYYYAQEGIEAFRNIRDTNWLHNQDWLDGGVNRDIWGSGFVKSSDPLKGNMYEIQSNSDVFTGVVVLDGSPVNSVGMKNYAPWQVNVLGSESEAVVNENGLKRIIYVYPYSCDKVQVDCSDYVRVVSKVLWVDGSEKQVSLNEIFTNWKGGVL